MSRELRTWIDAVSETLGLPGWKGALVLAAATYALFIVAYMAAFVGAGIPVDPVDVALFGLVAFLPYVLAALEVSLYVRRKMGSAEAYAMSMLEEPDRATDLLVPLTRLEPVAVVSVGTFAAFYLPYVLQFPGAPLIVQIIVTIPWLVAIWAVADALWALGFSLFWIFRVGRLPMKLRPFAVDRTLGLKPFASTSLRLTMTYFGMVAITLVGDLGDLENQLPAPYLLGRSLAFILLGILLFSLSVRGLHEKLLQAKSEKWAWINDRYLRVVQRIESSPDMPLDAGVQGELLGIDKIQRDIQSIRTWPFDMGSLAKLVTILMSLTAILASRIIAAFFGI